MMNGGIIALSLLFLLSLASRSSWCAAESRTTISADHLLQVQEFHGKKNMDIQSTRKMGRGQSLAHEVSAVEIKNHRRMATGHKGGNGAGGGGSSVTRPHNTKNGAAALQVPVASVLALSLVCGHAVSVLSF